MKLNRGIIHEYLGMILDYSTWGEMKFTMYNYIRDMITDFKQYNPCKKNTRTPASNTTYSKSNMIKRNFLKY